MKMLARAGLAVSVLLSCATVHAATVALPNCLNTPSVYTPCQGMVAVDPTTGNPIPWSQVGSGGSGGGSGAVYGPTANGLAPANPPVLTAGWDGANLQTLSTDTSGRLIISSILGAVTVSSSALPSGAASSANQATQITTEQAIQANQTNGTQVMHAVASTPVQQGGTIATGGATATITFVNTNDTEVINPSTGTLWASWGTPAVNGANSFPILANGSYRPPNRVAGTLTLLSTAAGQTYTATRF